MDVCSLVSFLLFGLVIGLIARFLMPGAQSMGWIMTIVLGIIGSFVGGLIASFIASMLGTGQTGMYAAGWIMSILGAMLVLFIYIKLAKK